MRILLAILLACLPSVAFGQWIEARHYGNFTDNNQHIYLWFNTLGTSNAPTALADTTGTTSIGIYEDGGTTGGITDAETLTVSLGTVPGLNVIDIDLGNAGFENGKSYTVVLLSGTVDSVSMVGYIVGSFSVGVPEVNVTQVNGIVAGLADSYLPSEAMIWPETTIVGGIITSGTNNNRQFNLTAGPPTDAGLVENRCIIFDADNQMDPFVSEISDYNASTKTIVLAKVPTYTLEVGDIIHLTAGEGK
jgi:hypothetical protein